MPHSLLWIGGLGTGKIGTCLLKINLYDLKLAEPAGPV